MIAATPMAMNYDKYDVRQFQIFCSRAEISIQNNKQYTSTVMNKKIKIHYLLIVIVLCHNLNWSLIFKLTNLYFVIT